MYVVIIGGGRIGSAVAKWLLEAEHEVAVIDRDPTKRAVLEDELGSVVVAGDGTEAGTLAKAGTNRADIVIATTSKDDENLVACQLAKHRFGASRTVALVNISDHDRLFSLLGIDVTINATELLVGSIQEELGEVLVEEVRNLG
jgi:trk system potassium uptake protein TrkA